MSPVVRVENLTRFYGRRRAVHDVSFEIERGEVLGLLGPNGSGKTTILRIITGYLTASSGRVSVAGHDLVDHGMAARRHIGYVPEDAPLYGHMRVVEAMAFMGRLKGLAGSALASAMEAAREQLSLQPVWNRTVSQLSRGYRQRVAIAQALLNEPDLLVLDEPTNGLDPRQIIELRELIGRLSARHAILVTSHILAEMERVASRVLILLDGELLSSQPLRRHESGGPTTSRIRIAGSDPQAVVSCLGTLAGVGKVHEPKRVADGVFEYRLECDGRLSPGDVAATVVAAGFRLVGLDESTWDLESVFLELTGERKR